MKNGYNIDLPLTSLIDLMELIKSRKSKIKILNNYILVDEKDKIPIRYIKTGLYAYLKGFRYNEMTSVMFGSIRTTQCMLNSVRLTTQG